MRKIATIQKIGNIRPIENADAIEVASVLGWSVVVKKGEYSPGDTIIFVEPDAWIPHNLAPFLSKGREPRVYEGVPGEKLRTVRLRGQYSQGLILDLDTLPQDSDYKLGEDVSEALNIVKYEPPVPAHLYGLIRGIFPSRGSKTEQNRIQNVYDDLSDRNLLNELWTVEEKIHGSSMSVIYVDGDVHVCSRNLSIKLEDDSNSMVKLAKETGIIDSLRVYCEKHDIELQISGEIYGEGINKNQLKVKGHRWAVFDVYNITERAWLDSDRRQAVISDLRDIGAKIEEVPTIGVYDLSDLTIDDILDSAEGKSVICPTADREGLVFKNCSNGDISFKSINRKWLAKGGDE